MVVDVDYACYLPVDNQPQAPDPIARREMAQHGPGCEDRVDLRHQTCCTDVASCGDRTGEQRIQMIAHPKRVCPGGHGAKIIGA